jgi:hypothetical protein
MLLEKVILAHGRLLVGRYGTLYRASEIMIRVDEASAHAGYLDGYGLCLSC